MSAGRIALSGQSESRSHSSNSEHAYSEIADLILALTNPISLKCARCVDSWAPLTYTVHACANRSRQS